MTKKKTGKRAIKASGAKRPSQTVELAFKLPEHPNVTLSDWLVVHANSSEVVKDIKNKSSFWQINVEWT